MATTLSQLMLAIAREATLVEDGIADTGDTKSLIDAQREESGGFFDRGIIWFTSGDNDGITRKINRWNAEEKKFDFDAVTAVSAGDTYSVATKRFTPEELKQAINKALAETRVPTYSVITNLGTASYAIPSGVSNVKRIEVDAGSDGEDYVPHSNWWLNGGNIYFDPDTEPVLNYEGNIRVTYMASHAKLSADTDTLNTLINDDYIKWLSAVKLLEKEDERFRGENPEIRSKLQDARAYFTIHAKDQPDLTVERTIRSSKWGNV